MRYSIAAVAVLFPVVASAQSGIVWSAFAGATSGRLNRPAVAYETKRGGTAGFTWAMQLNRYVAIEAGAAWVEKRGRIFDGGGEVLRLEYFEMPVSVRISDAMVGNGGRAFLRFGLATGTEYRCSMRRESFFPNAVLINSVDPFPSPDQCSQLRDRMTDFGPLAGIGVLVRRGLSQWSVEMRRTEGRRLEPRNSTVRVQPSTTALLVSVGRSAR